MLGDMFDTAEDLMKVILIINLYQTRFIMKTL
jgi:hypothetical protein